MTKMYKFRTILPVAIMAIAAVSFSSCSDDDLDGRLDKLEKSLGANEPLKVDFQTTNGENTPIVNKTSYLFKSLDEDDAIYSYDENEYYVTIERFADVEWYQGAEISFDYNAETKTVTNGRVRTYFYNQFSDWTNPYFYQGATGNNLTIDVLSFDGETGKISVNVTGSTDATAENNYYGKPMSISMRFRGTLRVFEEGAPK